MFENDNRTSLTERIQNKPAPPSRIPIFSTRLRGSTSLIAMNRSNAGIPCSQTHQTEHFLKLSDSKLESWAKPSSSRSWEISREQQRRHDFYQAQIEALHHRNTTLERRVNQLEEDTLILEDKLELLKKWYRALQRCYLTTNKQLRSTNAQAEERVTGLKEYCQIQQNFLAELVTLSDVRRLVYTSQDCIETLDIWKEWRTVNMAFLEYEFDETKEAQRKGELEELQQMWRQEKQLFKADVIDLVDEPPHEMRSL